jgi:hypothetical protein
MMRLSVSIDVTTKILSWRSYLMLDIAANTTDENLTSENWELVLNCCDKVQDEGQEGYAVPFALYHRVIIKPTKSIPQRSQCHFSYTQATSTPQSKRSTLCSISSRISPEKCRNRGKSGNSIQGVHTGSRKNHYRSGKSPSFLTHPTSYSHPSCTGRPPTKRSDVGPSV